MNVKQVIYSFHRFYLVQVYEISISLSDQNPSSVIVPGRSFAGPLWFGRQPCCSILKTLLRAKDHRILALGYMLEVRDPFLCGLLLPVDLDFYL